MSATQPALPPLAPATEKALQWATAAARVRLGQATDADFGVHDLFVGVAIAHGEDGENTIEALLLHFGIPLGAVTAGIYRPELSGAALARARSDQRTQGDPDSLARFVLNAAASTYVPVREGGLPLNAIVVALLQGTHPVAERIRRLLTGQGVDPEAVVRAFESYTRDAVHRPIAAFLGERGLHWPARVRLVPYGADWPGERGSGDGRAAAPDDLLGIGAEVDALAYLICATNLAPPLAVGLFGDWGSGKSYFMRALQRRIDGITDGLRVSGQSPSASPFHHSVVQIEFNAWHYVEGDLWASLVEHIFQNLRKHADEDEAEVRRRRDLVLDEIRTFEQRRESAAAEIEGLDAAVDAAKAALEERRAEAEAAREELARARISPIVASRTLLDRADDALVGAGGVRLGDSIDDTVSALDDSLLALQRGRGVLELIRTGGRPGRLIILMTVGVLAVLPLVSWALDAAGAATITNLMTSIGATLAVAAATLRAGSKVVNGVAQPLLDARAAAELERKRANDALDEQIARAAQDAAAAQDALDKAKTEVAEAEDRLAVLRKDLVAIPTAVFADFLDERIGSDDYRRHLGVPALIRRDFERLTRLVEAFNARIDDPDSEPAEGDDSLMNRIVLYIDDLDRCPADRVVKVLQAVHLLLAFPIFVVVVAVDSRWLAGSLRRRYGDLLDAGQSGRVPLSATGRARPEDYLEKIFQIPFRVRPLGEDECRSVVHGVLDRALVYDVEVAGDGATGSVPGAELPAQHVVEGLADGAVKRTPSRAAEALTVTAAELEAMDEVAPLLGETPRAVKRFTNVYLLIKSIALHSGRSNGMTPEAVILLLAVATGQAESASAVFDGIDSPGVGEATFGDLVTRRCPQSALARWASGHPRFAALPLDRFESWTDDVARFSFVSPARPEVSST